MSDILSLFASEEAAADLHDAELQLQLGLQPPPPLLWHQLEVRVPIQERDGVAAEIDRALIAKNVELYEECQSYYYLLLQSQSQLSAAVATAQRWQQHLNSRGAADATEQKRNRLKQELAHLMLQLTRTTPHATAASVSTPATVAARLDRSLTDNEVHIVQWVLQNDDSAHMSDSRLPSGSTSRPDSSHFSRPITALGNVALPARPTTALASRSQHGSRPSTGSSRNSGIDDVVDTAYSDATALIASQSEWDMLTLQSHYPLLRRALHAERKLIQLDNKWILAAIDEDIDQLTTEGTTVTAPETSLPSVVDMQQFADALESRLSDLLHEQRMRVLLDANRSTNQLLPILSPKSPMRVAKAVQRQPSAPSSLSDTEPTCPASNSIATHSVPKPPSAPVQRSAGQARARQYRQSSIDSDAIEKLLSAVGDDKMQSPSNAQILRL